MSKRAFDILPPYPKDEPRTYHHHNDKEKTKKKSVHTFLIFVFGLFFVFALFVFVKSNDFNISNSVNKNDTTKTKNNFELFNDQGSSTLSTQNKIISVKLQDGSNKVGNLTTAKDKLLTQGFEIFTTEKVLTPSIQTIIYYKNGKIAQARLAQEALVPEFSATISESTTLDKTYDLLILVGEK